MKIAFTTRMGLRYQIEVTEDLGHAYAGKVLQAKRTSFIGKVLVFRKDDMSSVVTTDV